MDNQQIQMSRAVPQCHGERSLSSSPPEPVDVTSYSDCSSNANEWECAACTYVNSNPLYLTCEVCGQARPETGTCEEPTTTNFGVVCDQKEPEEERVVIERDQQVWVNDHLDEIICEQHKIIDNIQRDQTSQHQSQTDSEAACAAVFEGPHHDMDAIIQEQRKLLIAAGRGFNSQRVPKHQQEHQQQRQQHEQQQQQFVFELPPDLSIQKGWEIYAYASDDDSASVVSDITMPIELVPMAPPAILQNLSRAFVPANARMEPLEGASGKKPKNPRQRNRIFRSWKDQAQFDHTELDHSLV